MGRDEHAEHRGFGGSETTLHETAMVAPRHCPFAHTRSRSNSTSQPNVNHGLWVMMCPWRFTIVTNAPPGGEVDGGSPRVYGKSVHLPLNFDANLQLLAPPPKKSF